MISEQRRRRLRFLIDDFLSKGRKSINLALSDIEIRWLNGQFDNQIIIEIGEPCIIKRKDA